MNAALAEPSIDVLLDGNAVITGLGFGADNGYQSESTGTHTFSAQATGTTTALFSQAVSLNANTDYTAIVTENASFTVTPIVLTDNNTAPASGNYNLRVVNASATMGPVDVYIVAPGTSLATATPQITNLTFGNASGYQSLAAGNFEVFITQSGLKGILVDTGTLSFTAGQIRTITTFNDTTGFTFGVLADLN